MSTLYLTTAERAIYDKIPVQLKSKIAQVIDENEQGPNSDVMLAKRAAVARKSELAKRSDVRELIKNYEKNPQFEKQFIDSIPNDVFPLILFVIGSRGISALMEQFLQTTSTSQHLEAITSLSSIRHNIIVSDSVLYA